MKVQGIQFASSMTVIQMKWMKVILMIENSMVQEFQHCKESQFIEAMAMKMYPVQFAPNLTAVQRQ
jgi:hypothetical protein